MERTGRTGLERSPELGHGAPLRREPWRSRHIGVAQHIHSHIYKASFNCSSSSRKFLHPKILQSCNPILQSRNPRIKSCKRCMHGSCSRRIRQIQYLIKKSPIPVSVQLILPVPALSKPTVRLHGSFFTPSRTWTRYVDSNLQQTGARLQPCGYGNRTERLVGLDPPPSQRTFQLKYNL